MNEYSWPSPYVDVEISPEIIHAVGAVIVSWNFFEISMVHFAAKLLRLDNRIALKIVGPLGNRSRQQTIQSWLSEAETTEVIKDSINHAIKLFDRNLTNRNLIAHGEIAAEKNPFFSSTKYYPEIKEVRSDDFTFLGRVLSEIQQAEIYLSNLDDHIFGRQEPLPEKPPLPVLLAENLPSEIYKKHPPLSSLV